MPVGSQLNSSCGFLALLKYCPLFTAKLDSPMYKGTCDYHMTEGTLCIALSLVHASNEKILGLDS